MDRPVGSPRTMLAFLDMHLTVLEARISALCADVSVLRAKLLSLEIAVGYSCRWDQPPFVELASPTGGDILALRRREPVSLQPRSL
jgi:hypothetical protein